MGQESKPRTEAVLSAKTCVSVCKVLSCDIISVQGSPFLLSLLLSSNGSAADSFPERIASLDLCYVLGGILKSQNLE